MSKKRTTCPCGAPAEVKGVCRQCFTIRNREKRRKQIGTQPHSYLVGVERICLHCGEKPPKPNSRLCLCEGCTQADKLAKARVRARNHVKNKQASGKVCICGCGGAVLAGKRHKYASRSCHLKALAQRNRDKPKAAPFEASKPKRATATPVKMYNQPKERPYAEPRESGPKAEVIIVPPHVTVTRIPPSPVFGRGLRNLFGDENGNTWSAVD